MINLNFKFMSLLAVCLLTGCMGVYEEGFDCKPGEGVGCKSISEVNTMINRGELPKETVKEDKEGSKASCKSCSVNGLNTAKPTIWFSPHWEGHSLLKPIHLMKEEPHE